MPVLSASPGHASNAPRLRAPPVVGKADSSAGVQDDVVPLGERADEVDALARIVAGHALEIFDGRLLAVAGRRVFLLNIKSGILVEHQIVEGDDVLLVLLAHRKPFV
jgi:hypothetical protein